MKRMIGWLSATFLALPALASAAAVTLNVSGTLNNAQGVNSLGVGVGQPYSLAISYDTNAANLGPACAPGTGSQVGDSNCRRGFDASSVRFAIDFGIDCDNGAPGSQPCTSSAPSTSLGSRIFVFNDFNDGTSTFDRLVFRVYEADPIDATHTMRWIVAFDSPDLSTLNGLTLPASLPAGFTTFNLSICAAVVANGSGGVCDTSEGYFRVDDTDGRVQAPEPATAALFGAGILGVLVRRRRLR